MGETKEVFDNALYRKKYHELFVENEQYKQQMRLLLRLCGYTEEKTVALLAYKGCLDIIIGMVIATLNLQGDEIQRLTKTNKSLLKEIASLRSADELFSPAAKR